LFSVLLSPLEFSLQFVAVFFWNVASAAAAAAQRLYHWSFTSIEIQIDL
jgi:hypothetical protein